MLSKAGRSKEGCKRRESGRNRRNACVGMGLEARGDSSGQTRALPPDRFVDLRLGICDAAHFVMERERPEERSYRSRRGGPAPTQARWVASKRRPTPGWTRVTADAHLGHANIIDRFVFSSFPAGGVCIMRSTPKTFVSNCSKHRLAVFVHRSALCRRLSDLLGRGRSRQRDILSPGAARPCLDRRHATADRPDRGVAEPDGKVLPICLVGAQRFQPRLRRPHESG